MKTVSLLLLLFTVYSSAALATWSGTSGWGETDWSSNEWGDKQWSDKEWGDKEWDKDHASCDPKCDVPEPGIVGLLAIGLLGLVVVRRRLNHK